MKKLSTIEAGRGIAAFLVVCFHATGMMAADKYYGISPLGGFFKFGYAGVDFFFVLSGFIIYFSSCRFFQNKKSIFSYLWKRIYRIYPIYWIVLIITLLPGVYLFHHPISHSDLIKDLFLIPRVKMPYIPQAWTLRHEMLFYLVFCLFFFNQHLAWFGFVIWQILIIFVISQGELSNLYLNFFFHAHNLEFFWGMLVAMMFQKDMHFHQSLLPLGLVFFLIVGITDSCLGMKFIYPQYYLLYGVASVAILMGLLSKEASGIICVNNFLLLLGKASYSIYLVHFAAMSMVVKLLLVFKSYFPLTIAYFLLVLSGVLSGLLVYFFIENKLLLFKKNKTEKN